MKTQYVEQRLSFLHGDSYLQKRESLPMALHSILHIVITWLFIVLILYINNKIINTYLTCFSIFIIGAVQHRFFTIYHEAFHYNLFRNKRLNDYAAMFFASIFALRISHAIFSVITRVLPVPAPAKTNKGEPICSTAFCCCLFNWVFLDTEIITIKSVAILDA